MSFPWTIGQWNLGTRSPRHLDFANFSYGTGGTDGTYAYLYSCTGAKVAKFMRYDPATDTWIDTLAATPGRRANQGQLPYWNGKFYLIAGQKGTTLVDTLEVWEYDVAGNTWTAKTSQPAGSGAGRLFQGAAVVNGVIYVVSAFDPSGKHDAYKYTIGTDTWASITEPGHNKNYSFCVAAGNLVHCWSDKFGVSDPDTIQHHRYDPVGDTWTSLSSAFQTFGSANNWLPQIVHAIDASARGANMMCPIGWNFAWSPSPDDHRASSVYNTATDTFTYGPILPLDTYTSNIGDEGTWGFMQNRYAVYANEDATWVYDFGPAGLEGINAPRWRFKEFPYRVHTGMSQSVKDD